MNYEDAKKKAQKLMAMAKDQRGNENEAERALAQAESLMRKFGIEAGELTESAASKDFDWGSDFAPYGWGGRPAKSTPKWAQYIATGVAVFTDTIARLHVSRELGHGVGFYGERSDTIFAAWLQVYLRDSVLKEAAKQKDLTRVEREEFKKAMASRLSARMRELRRERDKIFAESGTGTALVVISDKLAKREEQFGTENYKNSNVRYTSSDALTRGQEAGNKVGFNRPLEGTAERMKLA